MRHLGPPERDGKWNYWDLFAASEAIAKPTIFLAYAFAEHFGHDECDVAMFRSRSCQTLSHPGVAQRNTLVKYLTAWKSLPFSRLFSMLR